MNKSILRFISLIILALLLAACGGEEPAAEEAAPADIAPAGDGAEAAEPTAVPAEPEITPEPLPEGDGSVAQEPDPTAVPAAADPAPAPVGLLLQFQDAEDAPLSAVSLDLRDLEAAPADKTYAVWLVDDGGQFALLGAATAGQKFSYSDPDGRNLLGLYSGAAVSLEAPANVAAGGLAAPTNLVSSGGIPGNVVAPIRQLAVSAPDTPETIGYSPGLNSQADHAFTHSQLALDSIAGGDHAVAKIHLEHVNNILVGSESPDFGDLTGDGEAQNPGDGYGAAAYAFRVAVTAGSIAEPDNPEYLRSVAADIVVCAANISDIWSPEAVSIVQDGVNSADAAAAEGPGLDLRTVTGNILNGVDADGNGEIEIAKDECGAAQINELVRGLFSISMTVEGGAPPVVVDVPPAADNGDPAPPAPAGVTVSMLDFEFDAAAVTVPAGTTITWNNDGAAPHSATAVDGSFDTEVFDGGGSAAVTFDSPGTFAYYCILHGTPDGTGGMVGTVVVE